MLAQYAWGGLEYGYVGAASRSRPWLQPSLLALRLGARGTHGFQRARKAPAEGHQSCQARRRAKPGAVDMPWSRELCRRRSQTSPIHEPMGIPNNHFERHRPCLNWLFHCPYRRRCALA